MKNLYFSVSHFLFFVTFPAYPLQHYNHWGVYMNECWRGAGAEMRTRHEASSVGKENCDHVPKHSYTPLGMQTLVSLSS